MPASLTQRVVSAFLVEAINVLSAKNSKPLWYVDRCEKNAWATPAIVAHSAKTQVITTASGKVRGYDLNTGKVICKCAGLIGTLFRAQSSEATVFIS